MGDLFKKHSIRKLIMDEKFNQDKGYVNFFNDGSVSTDTNSFGKIITLFRNSDSIKNIEDQLFKSSVSYGFRYDYNFDYLKMDLIMGLVYRKEDIDENNVIREGAQPINDIVRYYTSNINSYLGDEKINKSDYNEYGMGYQGYLKYNDFVKTMIESEVEFIGPENFEEFKKQILSKEPFNISLGVDLKEEKTNKLTRKL